MKLLILSLSVKCVLINITNTHTSTLSTVTSTNEDDDDASEICSITGKVIVSSFVVTLDSVDKSVVESTSEVPPSAECLRPTTASIFGVGEADVLKTGVDEVVVVVKSCSSVVLSHSLIHFDRFVSFSCPSVDDGVLSQSAVVSANPLDVSSSMCDVLLSVARATLFVLYETAEPAASCFTLAVEAALDFAFRQENVDDDDDDVLLLPFFVVVGLDTVGLAGFGFE